MREYLIVIVVIIVLGLIYYGFCKFNGYYYREMDEILPNLYLGNLRDANNEELLQNNEITHVLSIIDQEVKRYPCIKQYKQIVIKDVPSSNLAVYFNDTSQFLDEVLNGKNKVLVHCRAGVSRSSSIIIAYLMSKQGMTYEDALKLVKLQRPIVCPNKGFVAQLKNFEKQQQRYKEQTALKGRHSLNDPLATFKEE